MKPVLVDLGGLEITSYGLSKALAALAAGWLLARELARYGREPGLAWPLTFAGFVGGFVGAKLYYLAENVGNLSVHDLGGTGFTWFGGLIGGALAVLWVARRQRIPFAEIAGMAASPLAVAYGIGRLGCLLAGDGTYGAPSDLPWAMSFPDGEVPTSERVHPAPLYEAIAAFATAWLLWRNRARVSPMMLFAVFAVLQGLARFLVEFVRLNDEAVAGLTGAQLWSLALMLLGLALAARELRGDRRGLVVPGKAPG
ncbi:MAG: prolipoprotein diacylglyceryl transferase [Thermoleophilaceae bacterium]